MRRAPSRWLVTIASRRRTIRVTSFCCSFTGRRVVARVFRSCVPGGGLAFPNPVVPGASADGPKFSEHFDPSRCSRRRPSRSCLEGMAWFAKTNTARASPLPYFSRSPTRRTWLPPRPFPCGTHQRAGQGEVLAPLSTVCRSVSVLAPTRHIPALGAVDTGKPGWCPKLDAPLTAVGGGRGLCGTGLPADHTPASIF